MRCINRRKFLQNSAATATSLALSKRRSQALSSARPPVRPGRQPNVVVIIT
ncbi:MAG: twin-arginine translocation signal domain-containing protein, partial [Planctomycetota bacterium]